MLCSWTYQMPLFMDLAKASDIGNFSTLENIIPRVPQGSISGLLLFNLFINDLSLFATNSYLSNNADDNTL